MMQANNKKKKEWLDPPNYGMELLQLIHSGWKEEQLKDAMSDYHAYDIASVLKELDQEARKKIYEMLDLDILADIFSYLDDVGVYVQELEPKKAVYIIETMDADDAVHVLEEMDEETRESFIELMKEESREDIQLIRSYDAEEVGSIMTTNYICIQKNLTVRQAMKSLITQATEHDHISTIYVVDEHNHFYGAIDLNELIIIRDYMELETIIRTSYPYVFAHDKITQCLERLKEYAEDSIPVLDRKGLLLGVVTAQNLIETVDDEMGDDYAKLGGLTEEEDLNESVSVSVKKRLPWLIILLVLGIGVSSVVGMFEQVVSKIAIIVCFQSLILDMAGNVGTQSLAVTIRILADGGMTRKETRTLIMKETKIGLCNGILLGGISFVVIDVFLMLVQRKGFIYATGISGCVAIALALSMLISSLVGTLIPLFFHKIKIDPAVASGPLITTVNDLVAVVTYYGLAWWLLIGVLHIQG